MDNFFKFPSTPHVAILPGVTVRDDKVMSPQERDLFLQHKLTVEEKIDGANLGISFDSNGNLCAQNRGAYLQNPYAGQWKKLGAWIDIRIDRLFEILSDTYILFGEWCYAQHSVPYTRLPDWFLGFDVWNKHTHSFLALPQRNEIFHSLSIKKVPFLAEGKFSLSDLEKMFTLSVLGDEPAEGLYLRYDGEDRLQGRGKLVRPAFVQSVHKHWSQSSIKPNRLATNIDTIQT